MILDLRELRFDLDGFYLIFFCDGFEGLDVL
jgi:hypothetical protein